VSAVPYPSKLTVARKLDKAFWALQDAYREAAIVRGLETTADDLQTFCFALIDINDQLSGGRALATRDKQHSEH
jgi:hypothetical protein